MEYKENVVLEKGETEQGKMAIHSAETSADETGSAVFKKFKDVNALARAYGALEAEFTRRSQRLKELERKMEDEKKSSSKGLAEDEVANGQGGCKTEKSDAVDEQVDLDVKHLENVVQPNVDVGDGKGGLEIGCGSGESKTAEDHGSEQGYGESAFSDGEKLIDTVVAPRTESVVSRLSDDEIYRMANDNEGVRIKIVGEYLASLKKAGVPLVRGGVGTVATPPSRARSVSEAGDMALRFFQTGK